MSNQTPAIVESDAGIAALVLQPLDPSDLRVDEHGRLFVRNAPVPGLGVSGFTGAVPDSGAANGQVVVKASPGNMLKAQFYWTDPFEGQLYFQLYNRAAVLALPTILLPFASIPFTMNKVPIIDMDVGGGTPFSLGLLLAISTEANTIVVPNLAGSVAAQFV